MKKSINRKQPIRQLLIVFIVVFGALLRTVAIDRVPPGVTNDEVGYFYNAYSIASTGKDMYGRFLPALFHVEGWPFMPVPVYIQALLYKFFGLSVFVSRFPSMAFGTISIILVIYLTYKLFRHRWLSVVAGAVLAFSPWHIHFSRTGYDGVYATFFYLLAVVIGVRQIEKGRSIFPMWIPFFLGFASHRASMVISVPILFIFFWYFLPILRHNKKYLLEIGVGIILLVASFVSFYKFQTVLSRTMPLTHEVAIFDVDAMKEQIDRELGESNAPLWMARIFNNKVTYTLRVLRENYLHVFSPQFLFTSGEADGIYSIWWRGQLYIIELPLLFVGLLYLYRLSRRATGFVLMSMFIAPLPAMISTQVYSMRSFYMVFFLPVLIGGGVLYMYEKVKNFSLLWRCITLGIFSISYIYLILGYLYQYHYRYINYGAERWFKAERDLAYLLMNEKERGRDIVISRGTVFTLLQFAYYSRAHPQQVQDALRLAKDGEIAFDSMRLFEYCYRDHEDPRTFLTDKSVYITLDTCHQEFPATSFIYMPKSIRYIWKIYDGREILRVEKK